MKNLIYIFLISIFFIACKKNNFIDEELIKTGWVLTDVLDENDDVIYENIDSTNRDIYLVFTSDLSVLGYLPTYRLETNISYEINKDGSIKISQIILPELPLYSEWEGYFLFYNVKINHYSIHQNELFLYFDEGKKFKFKRG